MTTAKRSIYLLRLSDEMRHPYERALGALGTDVTWFSTYQELVEHQSKTEPAAVIVDLDCLPQPLSVPLESLRATFPVSTLIALSGSDSAQLALQCIRSGFTDFLLKPASPEELAWTIRKSQQQRGMFSKLGDPRADMLRSMTQISTCNTPTLVRLSTLEALRALVDSRGAAWLKWDRRGSAHTKVLCSVPKRVQAPQILHSLPSNQFWPEEESTKPRVVRARKQDTRKVLLPCQNVEDGVIFLWGIRRPVTAETFSDAALLLEHAEMSLLNIKKYEELKQQTFLDDLTGLYNSRYLKFALTNAIMKCKFPNQCFSVLFIDVDRFKSINDKYGHLVGSEFLVAIGKTVKNAVRNIDPVFRYGGDEFVVILHGTPQQDAVEIAERIRRNIERRIFVLRGHRLQTTVSIGLATFPDHAADRDTLVRLADEAMYSAKRASRNAVHLAVNGETVPAVKAPRT